MVELVPAVCPKCGANLEVPGDLKIAHCIYCGAKVIIEESKPDIHYHGIGTVENYLELGKIMYEQGNYEKAIEYFNKALEINVKSTEAWYGRGLASERRGDDTDALFCYNKVLKINPKHEKTLKRKEAMNRKTRERMEKTKKRMEAMYRDTLNEAENELKKLLSELKKLEQVRILFFLAIPLLILFLFIPSSHDLGIGAGLVCTAVFIFPLLIFLLYFTNMWTLDHFRVSNLFEAIRSKQAEISKQREIVDDLKRHPPDKESF